MLLEEGGDAGEHGDVVVGVDAEVAGGDAAFGADGGGFGEDHACAADGPAAEVDEVPVGGVAVDRAVLAHGRDDDAVGEGDAALRERGEEVVGRGGHGGLDVAGVGKTRCGARIGNLHGREEPVSRSFTRSGSDISFPSWVFCLINATCCERCLPLSFGRDDGVVDVLKVLEVSGAVGYGVCGEAVVTPSRCRRYGGADLWSRRVSVRERWRGC